MRSSFAHGLCRTRRGFLVLLFFVAQLAPISLASSSNRAPAQRRVLVPNVLPATPERPFLDLGPVLVTSKQHATDPVELLLAESDRLGADAFVLESRSIQEVYGTAIGDLSTRDRVISRVVASLLTGSIVLQIADASTDRTKSGFYRAIRYLAGDNESGAVHLSSLPLTVEARGAFEKAASLREQYALAHTMLLDGRLEITAYERVRRQLADK